jgi:hypothetical protein
MTTRLLSLLLLALLALLPGLAHAQAADPRDADILRYLAATQQAAAFKYGIRSSITEEDDSSATLDAVLALPDADIEAAVLEQLRRHLDATEARALADFYDSDTGREITRQQFAQLGAAQPRVTLDPAQRAAHTAFLLSIGGEAERRLQALDRQDGIWGPSLPAIITAAMRHR